jgi:hypothetical protein
MPIRIPKITRAVVSEDQARFEPYPYIYVNADGTARELQPDERKYLETPFDVFDGARPAVKNSYSQKNGWGEVKGFMERSKLPKGMPVQSAPTENPSKQLTLADQFQLLHEKGWEVSETSKNTITFKKPNR